MSISLPVVAYGLFSLVNFIASISLAILFLVNKSKYTYFIFFNFGIAFWSLFYTLWQFSSNYDNAFLFCQLLMVGASFIPMFFLEFIVEFLGSKKTMGQSYLCQLNRYMAVLFSALMWTPLIMMDLSSKMNFLYWPDSGPLFIPFLVYFFGNFGYAFFLLFKNYQATKNRNDLYLFLATLIAFSGGTTNFFLWLDISIPPFANFFVTIYILLMGHLIVRSNILDLHYLTRLVLSKILIYVVITIIAVASYHLYYQFILPVINVNLHSIVLVVLLFFVMHELSFVLFPKLFHYTHDANYLDFKKLQLKINSTTIEQPLTMDVLLKNMDKLALFMPINSMTVYVKRYDVFYRYSESTYIEEKIESDFSSILDYLESTKCILSAQFCGSDKLGFFQKNGISVLLPIISHSALTGVVLIYQRDTDRLFNPDELLGFDFLAHMLPHHLTNIYQYETLQEEILVTKHEIQKKEQTVQKLHNHAAFGLISRGIAHEIRNPMQGIRSWAQMLSNDPTNSTLAKRAGDLFVQTIDQLTKKTNVMLSYSTHSHLEEKELLDLNLIISDIEVLFRHRIKELFLTLTIDCDPNLVVYANKNLIASAFRNVVVNATQFTPAHGRITITATHSVYSDKHQISRKGVAVSVSDTGRGISKSELNHIFLPFFTSKSQADNAGLGLAEVQKSIVESSNGMISVESVEGVGTTFTINLPSERV